MIAARHERIPLYIGLPLVAFMAATAGALWAMVRKT